MDQNFIQKLKMVVRNVKPWKDVQESAICQRSWHIRNEKKEGLCKGKTASGYKECS